MTAANLHMDRIIVVRVSGERKPDRFSTPQSGLKRMPVAAL